MSRILAAEFETDALETGRGLSGNDTAGRHRSDKADATHVGMAHQRGPDLAVAGDDVNDASGEYSFTHLRSSRRLDEWRACSEPLMTYGDCR